MFVRLGSVAAGAYVRLQGKRIVWRIAATPVYDRDGVLCANLWRERPDKLEQMPVSFDALVEVIPK